MSLQCPLCGKNKTDESLFCPNCTVKLNSEYEVDVPSPVNSVSTDETVEQIPEKPQSEAVIDNEETNNTTKLTKKELKESAVRTEKKYYEMSDDKPRKHTRFIFVSIFIIAILLISSVYIYNEHVKNQNLERSFWELANRENSVDAYLAYMDKYPHGTYVEEAQQNMFKLKDYESEAWENLKVSENIIEFTDFLQIYPNSPYQRMVKDRLDSLTWQSSLKDNSSQAYSDYINISTSGEISGQYIGEAQKRLAMLEQTTPIDELDLERIKESVNGFFTGLSNVSYTELANYLSPTIVRFNQYIDISRDKMIGHLLVIAAKEDSKSVVFDPEITKIQYVKLGNDSYNVNVPVQKAFVKDNDTSDLIKGYIIHLKLDPDFRIYSFYETKPFTAAP